MRGELPFGARGARPHAVPDPDPLDSDGHGTHTASTAAGNAGVETTIFARDYGTISGMAPRARVAAYKACWEEGCATTDLVAAIDAAVADGVDVINYSIGDGDPDFLDVLGTAYGVLLRDPELELPAGLTQISPSRLDPIRALRTDIDQAVVNTTITIG